MLIRSLIKSAFQKLGYDLVKSVPDIYRPFDVLPLLIKEHVASNPDFFFVQVGANDGEMGDPLRQSVLTYHLSGLLIEPLPDVFTKLRENYRPEPQLRFENVAIATENGRMPMYRVKVGAPFPAWYQGMASFRRENLARQGIGDSYIEELWVEAVTLRSLFDRHGIDRVNLLQVDTEGYDCQIVMSALESDILPDIINYEHCHAPRTLRVECKRILQNMTTNSSRRESTHSPCDECRQPIN